MAIYLNGLMLGLSLIMALGPQNVFLIRQGAMRRHAMLSAGICFFCDVILVCASVAGLHEVLTLYPNLQFWLICFGSVFLFYYGFKSLYRAIKPTKDSNNFLAAGQSRLQIIFISLGFSLLNPHAIIDSLVIIGSGSAQFPGHQQAFVYGVLTASLTWFTTLTFTTHYFSDVLSRATVWRRIELLSGVIMLACGLNLVFGL